jgi:hypothetical protein
VSQDFGEGKLHGLEANSSLDKLSAFLQEYGQWVIALRGEHAPE